ELHGSWEAPDYDRAPPSMPAAPAAPGEELHGSWEDPNYDKAPNQLLSLKSAALSAKSGTGAAEEAATTDAPKIPKELLPIEDAVAFKAEFQKALQDDEPWAKDLLAQGGTQRSKLES